MHVVLDRLHRRLLRGLEERADVDVEAHVGEAGGDHLGPAVMAVLAHLRDQQARASAFGLGEGGRERLHGGDPVGVVGHRRSVHAGDRPRLRLMPAPDHLEGARDLADGRLGAGALDGEREEVALSARRPGEGA